MKFTKTSSTSIFMSSAVILTSHCSSSTMNANMLRAIVDRAVFSVSGSLSQASLHKTLMDTAVATRTSYIFTVYLHAPVIS